MWFRRTLWFCVVASAVAAGWHFRLHERLMHLGGDHAQAASSPGASHSVKTPLVELAEGRPDTLRFTSDDAVRVVGIQTADVKKSGPPQPLRLPGTLGLDPNRIVRVHSRFTGEVVRIGTTTADGADRPVRYGDSVKKGQLLAVIWSREIGEKKSELVDAIARLEISGVLLQRLESLAKGIVPERAILEARRERDADRIAVIRAERTLRSWRLSDEEIDAIRAEVGEIQRGQRDDEQARASRWAEVEVRAPMDGVVVEKNFNVGDMVEPTDDLMKLADLSRLQIVASVYEEDLWALQALPVDRRQWTIDLKSDPVDNAIEGQFELIGRAIDPAQRTGLVMGWLDNAEGKYSVGQFLTATIQLPPIDNSVAIPEAALIEEGDFSMVFVESNAARREFTRCPVSVVRRCHGVVFIAAPPTDAAANETRVAAGEKVVVSGALGMGSELSNLNVTSSVVERPADSSGDRS